MPDAMQTRLPRNLLLWGGVVLLLALAVWMRVELELLQSNDYIGFTKKWFEHLQINGFRGLADIQSDYNPPYLYLLYLFSAAGVNSLSATKIISGFFDFVLAGGVYVLAQSVGLSLWPRVLAGLVTLFLPTVFLNSAAWGQCDAIFSSFLVLSLAAFIRRRDHEGWGWWGVAFIFKLQALFLLPVPLFLWCADRKRCWWAPVWVLPIYVASLMPSLVAGRDIVSLLKIYEGQVTQYFYILAYNVPTFYQWIPNGYYGLFVWTGTALALAGVALTMLALFVRGRELKKVDLIALSVFVIYLVVFLLPKMHERYFYTGEILALALAFVRPNWRTFSIAVLTQIIGLFAYQPYLFGANPPVPMPVLSLGTVAALMLMGGELFKGKPIKKPAMF